MIKRQLSNIIINESGVTAVVVALLMVVFLGFAALSVDLGYLYVVDNELQNAADAGALAGARFLYNDGGTSVNTGANQVGRNTAVANESDNSPVEVNWSGGNIGDVQRGHWQFSSSTFTPNDATAPVNLWGVSTEELDADPDFINAVRVVTRRESTPVQAVFSRIFGRDTFTQNSEAVAYLGFAGTLREQDVDQPIAICRESILNEDGEYDCSIGRMINSGQNISSSETGGWTSFNQDDPCTGGTNAQEVRSLVCGDGNPNPIFLGRAIATNGGEIQSAFNELYSCWQGESNGLVNSWNLTLPVVTCPGNNVGTCEEVVGAVNVNIVWISGAGEDPGYNNAPYQMDDWSNSNPDGQVRWQSFVNHFELENVDGTPAPYAKKSIYFKPDCTYHDPVGTSGGENFGIMARIPVLVD